MATPSIMYNMRMSIEEYGNLEREAARRGLSMAEVIRQALQYYFANKDKNNTVGT
jgi:hypothetical protein